MDKINESLELTKLFREIMHLVKSNMTKNFEGFDITMPQGMVIGNLARFGKMKVSELSGRLGLSNSTVSGIVDRLEKQGIVERVTSNDDKRVVYVSLTAGLEEMHKGFHKSFEEKILGMLDKGTPEEINKIIEGLNTLKRLLTC